VTLHPELAMVFRDIEDAGIRWCVLRLPPDPGKSGGDVDLLVDRADAGRLRPILAARGFVELHGWGGGLHFLRYDQPTDRWLWLHFVTELTFGPTGALRTGCATACLTRRQSSAGVTTLMDDDAFWALLLHCLLDKRAIAIGHRARLDELVTAVNTDGPLAQALATICPPGWNPERIRASVAAADWDSLERLAPMLVAAARRLRRRRPSGSALVRLRAWATHALHFMMTARHQRGLGVALLGPDGAGKSTLLAGIQESFIFPVRPMYMGLTGGLLPYVDRLRLPVLVVPGRLLVLWGRYLTARYHQSRGRLVVFDRYTYDAAVPTPQPLDWLGRAYRRIDGRACPPPDLVLLLDAPGNVMHARKGEYSPEMLEDWRQHFLALQWRVPQLEILDATRPSEVVRADAIERIWRRYAARWQQLGNPAS
jgi:thymidylate kinase